MQLFDTSDRNTDLNAQLQGVEALLNRAHKTDKDNENELQKLRIDNFEDFTKRRVALLDKTFDDEKKHIQEVHKLGLIANQEELTIYTKGIEQKLADELAAIDKVRAANEDSLKKNQEAQNKLVEERKKKLAEIAENTTLTEAEKQREQELFEQRIANEQSLLEAAQARIEAEHQQILANQTEENAQKWDDAIAFYNKQVEEAKRLAQLGEEAKKRKETKDKEKARETKDNLVAAYSKDGKEGKKYSSDKDRDNALADAIAEALGITFEEALQGLDQDKKQAAADDFQKRKDAAEQKTKDASAKTLQAALDFAGQLNSTIDSIASNKSAIDTRLYGSTMNKQRLGSYWDRMSADIVGIAGVSPLVKQADIVTNLKSLVSKGISYNVEQRAFLQTISEKIATTFDATNSTLLKLVRIQQSDTTAARLGMEAALNEFLNSMYETTEYMSEMAAGIRENIYEASALMAADKAAEFEYQIQKWMGSLYSVGMSANAVQGISSAIGKIAAGDISGITGGGIGNLVIMAADAANLPLDQILERGLTAAETNKLMGATVSYLANMYDTTKNSKVISQQIANVYGLTASDLLAAQNLNKSTLSISQDNLTYGGMVKNLYDMSNSMYQRTSISEILTNAFDNVKYSMAAGIANNPVTYSIYKIAQGLKSVAGGIALPDIKVMGTGVNLQTTVADLMQIASMTGGMVDSIAQLIMAGGDGGITGSGMLKAVGITDILGKVNRGGKVGSVKVGGSTVSSSGYVGNSESGDVFNKTMTDASDSGNDQLVEAQDETEETKLSTVDEHIVAIYQLLQDVTSGVNSLSVRFGDNTFSMPGMAGIVY